MNVKKLNRLKTKAYRDAYIGAHIDQGLAYQIKAIRESRGWDQKQLAQKIGVRSQSAIARMEDPSYGKLSISSLKKLAKAFDIGLLIKFVPYSRILTETQDMSPESLAVDSFEDEILGIEKLTAQTGSFKVYGNKDYSGASNSAAATPLGISAHAGANSQSAFGTIVSVRSSDTDAAAIFAQVEA